jgi:hypothetical protein
LSGSIKVDIIFNKVVFPAPFGPSTASAEPFGSEKDALSRARVRCAGLPKDKKSCLGVKGGKKSLVKFFNSSIDIKGRRIEKHKYFFH